MVATIRTWAFDPNHVVAGGTEDTQAQDSWFRFHELLRGTVGVDQNGTASSTGAWTVVQSSDSVTASAADNISASTDIVFAAGGVAHSWAVYQMPAALLPTRTLFITVDWNDAASPFRTAQIILSPSNPTGGSITARPTDPNEALIANSIFFSAAGFIPRRVHGWRSDIGELIVVFSQDGTLIPETGFWLTRPDNGESGILWPFAAFYSHSPVGKGAFTNAVVEGGGPWRGFWQDDTPLTAGIQLSTALGSKAAAWTLGRSNISSAIGDAPFDVTWNGTTEGAYAGRIVDIRATPRNVPENETQDGDADLVRRLTVGELWLPHRAAAGALVL